MLCDAATQVILVTICSCLSCQRAAGKELVDYDQRPNSDWRSSSVFPMTATIPTLLTPGGIQKLLRLTDKFHPTNVIVQILRASYPYKPRSLKIKPGSAIISDGRQCVPAIINSLAGVNMDEAFMGVYRIKDAVLCPTASEDEERFFNTIVIRELEKCTDPLRLVSGSPYDFSLQCRHESLPEENVTPLAAVPFISPRFEIPCIQVRVTFKSRLYDPRHPMQNLSFYIHFMDESSEVRAEVDTDVPADEIYDRFQVGKLYRIYYSSYEGLFEGRTFLFNLKDRSLLGISNRTIIEECSVISRLPQYRFSFTPLPRLVKMERNHEATFIYDPYNETLLTWSVDVIAIVKDVSVIDDTPKIPVRQVIIFDQSEVELLVKLWSYNAEEFVARPGDIVAFRNAHVLEHVEPYADEDDSMAYNILSVITPSTVHLEPEVEERYALRRWHNMKFPELSTQGSGLCKQEEQKAFAKLCEGQTIDT